MHLGRNLKIAIQDNSQISPRKTFPKVYDREIAELGDADCDG